MLEVVQKHPQSFENYSRMSLAVYVCVVKLIICVLQFIMEYF